MTETRLQGWNGMNCIAYLLTVVIATASWDGIRAVDLTIVAGSTGSSVVKACATKIRNSGIFPEDFDFLRNLAYVDSRDGTELTNLEPGGIWKVSEEAFTQTTNSSIDFSTYISGIESSFEISWSAVSYDNLSIPLYSALARRLNIVYLQTYETNMTLDSEANQALFWALYITDSGETTSSFSNALQQVSTGCSKPDRDIVFLVDSSTSSGKEALNNAALFVNNVIERLKVDTNQGSTVVGLAQYGSNVEVLTYLNSSKTKEELNSMLSNAELVSGYPHTGVSVGYAIDNFFQTSNGARATQTGTPRVLCVLLSGNSADQLNGIAMVAEIFSVNVIAVAMATVQQSDLSLVATGDDTTTAVLPTSFPPGSDIEFAVYNLICSASSVLKDGGTISGELQQDQERSYTIPVPNEGIQSVFSVTAGDLGLFYSTTNSNPSQAYYDNSVTVSFARSQNTLSYTPTAAELQDGSDINIYLTLQGLSSTPTQFTVAVGDTDVSVSVSVEQSSGDTAAGLSSGEISAIAFSGVLMICATIIAVVYYRYGRVRGGLRLLRNESSRKGAMKKSQERLLEIQVRERLQSAMMKRSFTELNEAVEDFMAMRLDDFHGDFVRAQRMLAIHQCKQGLIHAVTVRNIKLLERSISRAKRMEYDIGLKMDIVKAEVMLQDLNKADNLLRRLKRAVDSEDAEGAEAISTELRILRGCDKAGVKKMLLAFQLREDIEEAMLRRDVTEISDCIARIMQKRLENELSYELKIAKKMQKDLAAVERARDQVMALKQSFVSEIRSYQTPPAGLHEVMMSVYLLLGYHPMQLQSWTAIQTLMGKTGREGLRRMIGDLELRSVDIMHARMAKSLIENFDLQTIKELSDALALFYQFVTSVITEVQKLLPDSESPSFCDYLHAYDNSGHGSMQKL